MQTATALRRVHCLGNPEAQIPEMPPIGDCPVPVDRGLEPGIVIRKRIGHDMRRRIGNAVARTGCFWLLHR